jgi:hypothetical protein
MRNLRKEARELLLSSGARRPEEIDCAVRRYARNEQLIWWETLFLVDELEDLAGVALDHWHSWGGRLSPSDGFRHPLSGI